jgi:hypothetical protein
MACTSGPSCSLRAAYLRLNVSPRFGPFVATLHPRRIRTSLMGRELSASRFRLTTIMTMLAVARF